MDAVAYNVKVIRKALKKTQQDFADLIGATRGAVAQWELGNNKPGGSSMVEICRIANITAAQLERKKLPADFVIPTAPKKGDAKFVDLGSEYLMSVPFISGQYAYAGYLTGYSDPEYLDDLPTIPWIVEKEHKGNYICIEVRNDSMFDGSFDGYKPGDKVLCREVPRAHWRDKLHIDKWDFVIVHKTDGILLKKISKHNTKEGILTLHSLNPTYEDFTVHQDDVAQIFNVVQVARKK